MGFYKFLKEYQGFLFIHVFFYMYQYSFMVLNCQQQDRHINLIVPNLSCVQALCSGLYMYFFHWFLWTALWGRYLFLFFRAESWGSERLSDWSKITQLLKCHNKNLNPHLCDIKACALTHCLLNNNMLTKVASGLLKTRVHSLRSSKTSFLIPLLTPRFSWMRHHSACCSPATPPLSRSPIPPSFQEAFPDPGLPLLSVAIVSVLGGHWQWLGAYVLKPDWLVSNPSSSPSLSDFGQCTLLCLSSQHLWNGGRNCTTSQRCCED